jgi:hypothetical protein
MDFTAASWPSSLWSWVAAEHGSALGWFAAYVTLKGAARFLLARKGASAAEVGVELWDPVCLVHNALSVAVGLYAAATWDHGLGGDRGGGTEGGHSLASYGGACRSVSDPAALVILLQACHSASDFLVFLPQMFAEPVLLWHHGVLLLVSLVLPRCNGCFFSVVAFAIAEFGSASIAVDAEWRKAGGASRGFTRVVIFGGSRLVNLLLLHQIWRVTPSTHEFSMWDDTSGALVVKANIPVCLLTAVGGSAMMLCVNGLTWWRMFRSYRKVRVKRKAAVKKGE